MKSIEEIDASTKQFILKWLIRKNIEVSDENIVNTYNNDEIWHDISILKEELK